MEDKTSGKGSTLILWPSFLMTAITKIDMHVWRLPMEFGDTVVQFNIFEAMKLPTEDHSFFGIDLIDELVEDGEGISDFDGDTEAFDCLRSIIGEVDCDNLWKVHDLSDSEDDNIDLNRVPSISDSNTRKNVKSDSNLTRDDSSLVNRSRPHKLKVEIMLVHLLDPEVTNDNSSSSPPPMELEPFPSHFKYAYLDIEQQLPVIIANNLHQEQEDKLLHVLRQHKKAIGWKLSNLPGINPFICMHRILMEEEAKPIRQH
ncbi:hypothetical protein CR513_03490, partial [Mucuna pruriens]